MKALLQQIKSSIRLNLRNPMAMLYGYLFPLIFLIAFWTIYRHDRVPMLLHVGELLTVTILGGSCFGLPTTLVSERERGVWRRYRLSPAPAWIFVAGVLVTRYLLLITASLLQLGIALAIGMTMPKHPVELLAAFSVSAIAFMGIGLQIAMLADSVPAVQALGQCVFLPMLMVGGVAVPLLSLPRWAMGLSAFLPGRYSVHAIQAAMGSSGVAPIAFDLLCLTAFGFSGLVAALCTFRWNPTPVRSADRNKAWLAVALLVWLGAGVAAWKAHHIFPAEEAADAILTSAVNASDIATPATHVTERPEIDPSALRITTPAKPAGTTVNEPARWQDVTQENIRTIAFDRLPPDDGLISPIAHSGEISDPEMDEQLEQIRSQLATWVPGKAADLVQRVRNDLYVAGIPDLYQIAPMERFIPLLVFSRLRSDIPAEDLPKILYWIATHPDEGDDSAVQEMSQFELPIPEGRKRAVRGRAMIYAMKLLGRQTGLIAMK